MALDKATIKNSYPLPSYNYRVTIFEDKSAVVAGFSEVSGLQAQYNHVTYRHGMSFAMGQRIIPGQPQEIKVTLKRGVVKGNDLLHKWFSSVYSNPFLATTKRDVVIDLCDETGTPVVRWTVTGALPVKLEGSNLAADSNDVVIETVDLVAHRLTVSYSP